MAAKASNKEYASYMDKEPSALHQRNAQWIKDNVGYDADVKTIQLALTLNSKFQKSDFNRDGAAAEKAEREAARAARKAAPKKAAPAKKAAAKKAPARKAPAKKAAPKPRPRKPAKTSADF